MLQEHCENIGNCMGILQEHWEYYGKLQEHWEYYGDIVGTLWEYFRNIGNIRNIPGTLDEYLGTLQEYTGTLQNHV